MKRVRMLLRVSSDRQLEADGDLSVQREIVREYVQSHDEWILDDKEYFEGSNSGYKNSVLVRGILQAALRDARNGEYDILAAYKDDRVGRLMWEIGAYIMALKGSGVDIYTVKDGCISPEADDIMGQMMLALRYGNAQKSSADTGMRVKDTAQKLVRQGKFMGGAAPYGYRLELSGEISKHGRALHRLEIVPEQAEVVRRIYHLSLYKEYGSGKIARTLNEDTRLKGLAPHDEWKSGTITSILTNPVYAGYVAYKRRERINGAYHRLDGADWIKADRPNEGIRIIDSITWDKAQEMRKKRSDRYRKTPEHADVTNIRRNDGSLCLIDVAYCGYCGRKLTNGTRYSYWTIKGTGEKRASKTPAYRCQAARMGIPHDQADQFRADQAEKVVLFYLGEYISRLLEKEDIVREIEKMRAGEKEAALKEIEGKKRELEKTLSGIKAMQSHIPEAAAGGYPLGIAELAEAIHMQQEKKEQLREQIREKEQMLGAKAAGSDAGPNGGEQSGIKLLTWEQIFDKTDAPSKRILANKLIRRVDITREQIVIRFR